MDDAVAWHNAIAHRFSRRYVEGRRFRERFQAWDALIRRYGRPSFTAVDLGCGPGVFTGLLAECCKDVLAIDGSPTMLETARETLREFHNITFQESRLELWNGWSQTPIQLAVCSSVIEYMDQPDAFLTSCRRGLSSGGILLISMPNGASLYRRLEWLLHRLTGRPRYYGYVRTVETPRESRARIVAAGF